MNLSESYKKRLNELAGIAAAPKLTDEQILGWYPRFKGRVFKEKEDAENEIRAAVNHDNSQSWANLFGKTNVQSVLNSFDIIQGEKGWRIISPVKEKRKPVKKSEYLTDNSLAQKQIQIWVSTIGREFGRHFSNIIWKDINDPEIYGTETQDESDILKIVQLIKNEIELPPILLDYDGGILDGHHRWEAAKILKIKQIPVIVYHYPEMEKTISENNSSNHTVADGKKYLYHGTYDGAGFSIQRDGGMRVQNSPLFSFSEKIKVAEGYAIMKGGKSRGIILRTPMTDDFALCPRFNKNDGFEYVTKKEIPIEDLEILGADKKWHPLPTWDFIDKKTIEETSMNESDLKFSDNGKFIHFKDSLGGHGFLSKKGDEVNIINWQSVPDEKRYSSEESKYKRRGFARSVIKGIKELGYNQFTINMPSAEATAALNKLSQEGAISPIPGSERGVSIAQYFTKFKIN